MIPKPKYPKSAKTSKIFTKNTMSTDYSSHPFPPIHLCFLILLFIFITLFFTKNTMTRDYSSLPFPSVHLCFLLLILFTFITFPWYMNYESSIFEGLYDQIKLVLIFSPLILLVVVHLVSRFGDSRSPFFLPLPAGGTPWTVGFLLVFLFFMITDHSSLQERWFPLLYRSTRQ